MTYRLEIPKEFTAHPELKLDFWFEHDGNTWQLIPSAGFMGVRLARKGEYDFTGKIQDAKLIEALRAAMKGKEEIWL